MNKIAKNYNNVIGLSTHFIKNIIPTIAGMNKQMAVSDVVEIKSKTEFIRPIYGANAF